jgi:hypothetical protein
LEPLHHVSQDKFSSHNSATNWNVADPSINNRAGHTNHKANEIEFLKESCKKPVKTSKCLNFDGMLEQHYDKASWHQKSRMVWVQWQKKRVTRIVTNHPFSGVNVNLCQSMILNLARISLI